MRRWPVSSRTLLLAATAFVAGFVAGLGGVVIEEHHDSPWASVLVSAGASILARLIFVHGEVFAWSKIVGTALLYALYAYLLTESRSKGVGLSIAGFHGACAAIVALPRVAG